MTTPNLAAASDEPGIRITPPDDMPRNGDEPATAKLLREARRPDHTADTFSLVALGG